MEILRGTLDLLILNAVAGEPMHGYGIAAAIGAATGERLRVQEGVLYPTLRKLEARGDLASAWGRTESGRDARYYELTARGRRQLRAQERAWRDYVRVMDLALGRT
jgi:PadR family transcriptional regulator, regulatory protein PadR